MVLIYITSRINEIIKKLFTSTVAWPFCLVPFILHGQGQSSSPDLQKALYLVLHDFSTPKSNSLLMANCRTASLNSSIVGYSVPTSIDGLFLSYEMTISPGTTSLVGMAAPSVSYPISLSFPSSSIRQSKPCAGIFVVPSSVKPKSS